MLVLFEIAAPPRPPPTRPRPRPPFGPRPGLVMPRPGLPFDLWLGEAPFWPWPRPEPWLRTTGVDAHGAAAAKVINFGRLGKRYALALLGI